ncbi:hypothetical protein [Sphingomonas sp. UNC305MFCol5.2]|uniref:hypothetical protein n=1 Tax=Sphingomonas sp. UNC305MFCol5.2 TaxID=1449076 RepID=UPI0004A6F10C|nr:hypothetical protein [Sphingomonas sp. UNC305MFCol5.2]
MAEDYPVASATEPWSEMARWAVEWPVAMSGLWWAWALTAWHSHHHRAPGHHDLPVPAPIADEGEPALFA